MVIRLRHRIADAVTLAMMLIGYNDLFVDSGMGFFQPCSQCRSQIIANSLKVALFSVAPVTFGSNFLVVVGKRSSARLYRDRAGKWVLTRRLVKMAMHAEVDLAHL